MIALLDFFNKNKIVILVIIALFLGGCILAMSFVYSMDAKYQKAIQMSQQQMSDIASLQKELNMSKQNAEMLKTFYEKTQTGQVKPNAQFYVSANNNEDAAQQVKERINDHDNTLPSAALEATDTTTVVPKPGVSNGGTQQVGVDVYKYNGYRNWEWSIGGGVHDGKAYVPLELQRNISKDKAISAEIHIDSKGKVSGYEAKYTIMTNRLFFLF